MFLCYQDVDRNTVERVRGWMGLVSTMVKCEFGNTVYILQGARIRFSSFIVMLSKPCTQSDARHMADGIRNGSIISWPSDARPS